MTKAVIFDMDGLMIDSERVTYEGYVKECGKLGLEMDVEFYIKTLGLPLPTVFKMYYKKYGKSFPMEQVLEQVHQYIDDRFQRKGVPVKRGLEDLLKYLKDRGYKTVIATSSNRDRVDRILDQTGLREYFDDSVCGDEVKKGKPNPEIFVKACKKIGVKRKEALVLEDSEAGIKAAHSARIPVVCVPDMKYPALKYSNMTRCVARSLEAVLELFQYGRLP